MEGHFIVWNIGKHLFSTIFLVSRRSHKMLGKIFYSCDWWIIDVESHRGQVHGVNTGSGGFTWPPVYQLGQLGQAPEWPRVETGGRVVTPAQFFVKEQVTSDHKTTSQQAWGAGSGRQGHYEACKKSRQEWPPVEENFQDLGKNLKIQMGKFLISLFLEM